MLLLLISCIVPILEALDQMKIRLFCDGVPVASAISLTDELFKAANLLMACSIVQGGPAPNFMSQWVYDYLAFGLHNVPLNPDDIEDVSVRNVVDKVSVKIACSVNYLWCQVYISGNPILKMLLSIITL